MSWSWIYHNIFYLVKKLLNEYFLKLKENFLCEVFSLLWLNEFIFSNVALHIPVTPFSITPVFVVVSYQCSVQ